MRITARLRQGYDMSFDPSGIKTVAPFPDGCVLQFDNGNEIATENRWAAIRVLKTTENHWLTLKPLGKLIDERRTKKNSA